MTRSGNYLAIFNSDTVRELTRLIWSQSPRFAKQRLVFVLLLLTVTSVLAALGPVALKWIVDALSGSPSHLGLSLPMMIALYVAGQWLARVLGETRGLAYARAARRIHRSLSERMFAHVMQLPLQFHLERRTGAISQILENGLQGYQLILHHLVFNFLPVLVQLATMVVVLSRLGQPMPVVLFSVSIIGYAIAFTYAARKLTGPAAAASSAHLVANAAMTDSILSYETIKYFTAESLVQERVSQALLSTENHWVNFWRRLALNGIVTGTIFALVLGATVYYSASAVLDGQLSTGTFVLINAYLLQIMHPLEMLGVAIQGFAQGGAMLDKMLCLLKVPPETCSTSEGRSARQSDGSLEFSRVGFSFADGRVALREVSFKVAPGRTLGIVGASGSGKSTLVRLLARLYEPTQGRILLDGTPISAMPLAALRRAIAVVPQDSVLLNDTIGFNISFGRPGCTQAEVEAAARLACLHDFIMSLPDRYETQVGERGMKLSGGEKQRVSIARAILKKPLIYVFDEATASLDSHIEHEIMTRLYEVAWARTTIVIAHRLSTVVNADEIIVLDKGTVAETGVHASLLGLEGIYASLWRTQHSIRVARAAASLI